MPLSPSPERTDPDAPVDFTHVPSRLRSGALALSALALLGCIVDGALNGLTFAVIGRWVGILAVALLIVALVAMALHAMRVADVAAKRGDRLSSPDVGIAPRRFGPTGAAMIGRAAEDVTAEDVTAEDATAEDETAADETPDAP